MPKCCGCNSSGACKFCVCARSGRRCLNCSPSQHNRCLNFALPGTTAPAKPARPSSGSSFPSKSKRSSLSKASSSSSSPSSSSCPPFLPATRASKAWKTSATGVSAGAGESSGIASNVQTAANAVAAAAAHVNEVRNAHADKTAEMADGQQTGVSQKSVMKGVNSLPGSNDVIDSQQQLGNADDYHNACLDSGVLDWQKGIGSLPDFPPSAEPVTTVLPGIDSNTRDTNNMLRSTESGQATATGEIVRPKLPDFTPSSMTDFSWGPHNGADFEHIITCAYAEIVHWRRNVFLVPSGKVGKEFIRELTSLFSAYAQASALESVALTSVMVVCAILLQKPHPASKSRDHISALERRLSAWRNGDIDGLMREGRTIQAHLQSHHLNAGHGNGEHNARIFSKLMLEGKTHAALRFLSENPCSGILNIDDHVDGQTVLDALRSKHPPAGEVDPEALITSNFEPPETHPVLFESLTAQAVRNAALRTKGSAGPSGIDAAGWKRMCTSFHKHSSDLCASIAAVGRRISTEFVDPEPLQAFLACRLVPLSKNPGVRPIGVCETIRRILGKAIMCVVAKDVQWAAGPIQLCCGQDAGCEAAVHAIRSVFEADDTDAILLVDATNAFNNLNRFVALYNIQYLCPAIAKVLINCYRMRSSLFVSGKVIQSCEGTTQGDPLAMALFGLATLPLIEQLKNAHTIQCWFADDAAAGSRLHSLRQWWDQLTKIGPKYGYFPNGVKTYLVAKPESVDNAKEVFGNTNVQITCFGRKYLGGALGTEAFEKEFIEAKISEWSKEVVRLAEFAESQPHAAYAAFTHGLVGRWTHALRLTTGVPEGALKPLEDAISHRLIPRLTDQPPPNEHIRELLALPARLGGLALVHPATIAAQNCSSKRLCEPLIRLIIKQTGNVQAVQQLQKTIKQRIHSERRRDLSAYAKEVIERLPVDVQRCALAAQERGTSSWLTALPIAQHGFPLTRADFRDAIALRYGWPVSGIPQTCACGQPFTVSHALICRCGGYIGHRHDQLRDLTATLLQEVCINVAVEPQLQPLRGLELGRSANTDDGARLDIRATGFWNGAQDAFFDLRVFYPFASSYQNSRLPALYKQHETRKRTEYGRRVREIEGGSFTPLVFTTGGGMAGEATIFYKRLASLLSEKRDEPYSVTMGWLRCVISISLLRSSIRCIRGTRKRLNSIPTDNFSVASVDSHLLIK